LVSLTALPAYSKTQAGDVSAYISNNVISITDGRFILEPSFILLRYSSGISTLCVFFGYFFLFPREGPPVGSAATVKAMNAGRRNLENIDLGLPGNRDISGLPYHNRQPTNLDKSNNKRQLDRGSAFFSGITQAASVSMPCIFPKKCCNTFFASPSRGDHEAL